MHQVRIDLPMEFGLGDMAPQHREITTPVTAIRLCAGGCSAPEASSLD